MPESWTQPQDIEAQWRPLRPSEAARAPGLIALTERHIRRTWPETARRLGDGELTRDDIADVVVWAVVPLLAPGVDLPPHVKTWQETSGSESESFTLEGSTLSGMLVFAGWMVDVFEGATRTRKTNAPLPRGGFPPSGGYERLFGGTWPEVPRASR